MLNNLDLDKLEEIERLRRENGDGSESDTSSESGSRLGRGHVDIHKSYKFTGNMATPIRFLYGFVIL